MDYLVASDPRVSSCHRSIYRNADGSVDGFGAVGRRDRLSVTARPECRRSAAIYRPRVAAGWSGIDGRAICRTFCPSGTHRTASVRCRVSNGNSTLLISSFYHYRNHTRGPYCTTHDRRFAGQTLAGSFRTFSGGRSNN